MNNNSGPKFGLVTTDHWKLFSTARNRAVKRRTTLHYHHHDEVSWYCLLWTYTLYGHTSYTDIYTVYLIVFSL